MILVDSSVWIDYFRGSVTRQTDILDALPGRVPLAVGDLILAEVLQGFQRQEDFIKARHLMMSLEVVDLCDPRIAVAAAANFRQLRELGITVRKTIDTVIATKCIADNYELLHCDRDFDPFAEHLGLGTIN